MGLQDIESEMKKERVGMGSNLKELRDRIKGFANPKRVEGALLADGIDPTDSTAVEVWLGENGDDFASAPAAAAPAQGVPVLIPDLAGEQERVEAWLQASGQALWSAPVVQDKR